MTWTIVFNHRIWIQTKNCGIDAWPAIVGKKVNVFSSKASTVYNHKTKTNSLESFIHWQSRTRRCLRRRTRTQLLTRTSVGLRSCHSVFQHNIWHNSESPNLPTLREFQKEGKENKKELSCPPLQDSNPWGRLRAAGIKLRQPASTLINVSGDLFLRWI